MFDASTTHDTYYIVGHFHWLLSLALASALLLTLTEAVRRRSSSRLAQRLRRLALAGWLSGLVLTALAMLTVYTVPPRLLPDRPWLFRVLNEVSSVASFLMVLATVLCLAMICIALWHRVFRHDL